jgi:HEAT repeat
MNENSQDAMTKGRKLQLLALVLALAVGGLVYAFMKPADPVYRGKPLSVWVSSMTGLDAMLSRLQPELNAVIQELDQRGIERLGAYVSGRNLSQRKYYRAFYNVLPGKVKRLFPAPDLKQQFRVNAAVILAGLKQKARPAMPHLIAAVADTELNGRIRELAARTLFHFGPDAEPAIGALTKALNDPDEAVVECAARALGAIGPGASNCLSVLESKLGGRRDYLTVALAEAIWQIDSRKASRLAPILRECVQHTNAYSRVYGSKVLWAVIKDASRTVPVLTAVIADTNQVSFHQWSIMLLGEIGPAASNAVPLIEAKTKEGGMFAEGIQKAAREALSKITNAQ